MKICFLGDVRSFHVQKFVKYFARDNETHLVSFPYAEDERTDPGIRFFEGIGTDVHLIPMNPFVARATVREIEPDIVQCHFLTNYGFCGAVSGIHPLVMSAMGDDILIHPHQLLYGFAVRYALHHADMVTCDGHNSYEAIANLGVPKESQMLLYPGVDTDNFHPNKRQALPYQQVFYPRGFDKIYGVDMVYDVIDIVHRNLPDVRFALMGGGTELSRFEDRVRSNGIRNVVDYLGYVRSEDVPRHFASSDVSFTCSLSDGGIPTSTIEAMACGVPVVSTNVGDARLWVRNGETGYTVDSGDAVSMADRIISILTSEDRVVLGGNARRVVERTWNYDDEMKRVDKLYLSLLS